MRFHNLQKSLLAESRIPADKDGNDLIDMDDKPVPMNSDGTITLYHFTSPENKSAIEKTGKWLSKEQGKVFFTTLKDSPNAEGYGEAIVTVKINPRFTEILDAFHGGEVSVAIAIAKLERHGKIIHTSVNEGNDILSDKAQTGKIKSFLEKELSSLSDYDRYDAIVDIHAFLADKLKAERKTNPAAKQEKEAKKVSKKQAEEADKNMWRDPNGAVKLKNGAVINFDNIKDRSHSSPPFLSDETCMKELRDGFLHWSDGTSPEDYKVELIDDHYRIVNKHTGKPEMPETMKGRLAFHYSKWGEAQYHDQELRKWRMLPGSEEEKKALSKSRYNTSRLKASINALFSKYEKSKSQ